MAKGIQVVEDNTDKALSELDKAVARAMYAIGQNAEKYAKALCPVGTVESTGKRGYRGGTLRNSITNIPTKEDVTIGTNVEYAPYVELGTGPNFQVPPEWEQFDVPTPSGIGHSYVKPRPFIKPAIADHIKEFENIIENELKS